MKTIDFKKLLSSKDLKQLAKTGIPLLIAKVVIGVVVLIVAHILGMLLKGLIVKKGQKIQDKISQRNEGSTEKDKLHQLETTNLMYSTIGNICYFLVLVLFGFGVFALLGIKATALVALVGTVGFGVGLALQGILNDIASGILLSFLNTYAIGEVIAVNGVEGRVLDFTLTQTIIMDVPTQTRIVVPNRKIQDNIVQNHSREPKRLFVVDILLSNKNKDFQKVIDVVKKSLTDNERLINSEYDPQVTVLSMDKTGTMLRTRSMIYSKDYPNIGSDIRTRIRIALSNAGVIMVDWPLQP